MAAPTYVNHGTGVVTGTSITVTNPSGTQSGDYMLVHIQHSTGNLGADGTAPAGWSLIGTRQENSSSSHWYYEKLAGGSEPGSWDWTGYASATLEYGIVVTRGADQTTPRHTEHLLQNTNIGGTTVALSVMTSVADCLLVAFAGQDQTVGGNTWSQASMTERYDESLTADLTHCGYTETAATATTYNRTITASTAQRISGALIAVAPAATATDLVVQNAAQAQTADNATLAQVHNLAVAGATQAQSADSPTLTQVHNLTVAGATQGQTAANVTLTQVHNMILAGATQAQSADNVAVNVATNLTVADANQAQAAQQVTLTQTHNLAVQAAAQAQTAGNVSLSQVHELAVQAAAQGQAAASAALAQIHILTVQGSTQAQSATTITLGTDPLRDVTVVARLRTNHVTGGVGLTDLVAGLRSNHITGGVDVPRNMLTGSVEYVTAEVTFAGETAASIATVTGQVTITSDDTIPSSWEAVDVTERTDVTGGALLALKKLHTAGAAGEYRVWAKVTDNPEIPILKCGTVTVR